MLTRAGYVAISFALCMRYVLGAESAGITADRPFLKLLGLSASKDRVPNGPNSKHGLWSVFGNCLRHSKVASNTKFIMRQMITTHCMDCTEMIVNLGLDLVFFIDEFNADSSGLL